MITKVLKKFKQIFTLKRSFKMEDYTENYIENCKNCSTVQENIKNTDKNLHLHLELGLYRSMHK